MKGKRTIDSSPITDARTAAASTRALSTESNLPNRKVHPRTGLPLGEWEYIDKAGKVRTINLRTRKFIQAYAETGNKALAVRMSGTNARTAVAQSLTGQRRLNNAAINEKLQEILDKMNVTPERILQIHTRNMLQSDNLNVSQRAVETFEELVGIKPHKDQQTGTVNVSINIE